jgi:hypothetical protein
MQPKRPRAWKQITLKSSLNVHERPDHEATLVDGMSDDDEKKGGDAVDLYNSISSVRYTTRVKELLRSFLTAFLPGELKAM